MKKHGLLFLGVLAFSSIALLSSCNNENTQTPVETILEDASLTLDYNEEFFNVSVIDDDGKYFKDKKIALNIEAKNPNNYAFSYATLNNEKIDDITNISLVKGQNYIKIYAKSIFVQEGTTNLRDFTFVLKADNTYKITGYTPSGLVPTRLEIPSSYLGKEISEIAFDYNLITGNVESQYSFSQITTVYIPKTIKTISSEVFLYGESVESFEVDPENPVYGAINKSLFDKVKFLIFEHP